MTQLPVRSPLLLRGAVMSAPCCEGNRYGRWLVLLAAVVLLAMAFLQLRELQSLPSHNQRRSHVDH